MLTGESMCFVLVFIVCFMAAKEPVDEACTVQLQIT